MKKTIWTKEKKAIAKEELLDIANQYEMKKRTDLRNVIFLESGQAKFIGQAHDYSYWINKEQ